MTGNGNKKHTLRRLDWIKVYNYMLAHAERLNRERPTDAELAQEVTKSLGLNVTRSVVGNIRRGKPTTPDGSITLDYDAPRGGPTHGRHGKGTSATGVSLYRTTAVLDQTIEVVQHFRDLLHHMVLEIYDSTSTEGRTNIQALSYLDGKLNELKVKLKAVDMKEKE